ncbi:hypothetical protein, partial [Brasilonema sp. UFV-L1]|uniref:hypothetical protein n=1 Tax=Brasilonema sp. UFV-L1 TaxID=2234130 RepID=UPI00145C4B97
MISLKFSIVFEDDDSSTGKQLTRQNLAKDLGIHFNTLRKYELLLKEVGDFVDAENLPYQSDKPKLEGVELTPYLAWLLVKVHNLRSQAASFEQIKNHIFMNSEKNGTKKSSKL